MATRARVPTHMMEFVTDLWHFEPMDDLAEGRAGRIGIDGSEIVGLLNARPGIDRYGVEQFFPWRPNGLGRAGIPWSTTGRHRFGPLMLVQSITTISHVRLRAKSSVGHGILFLPTRFANPWARRSSKSFNIQSLEATRQITPAVNRSEVYRSGESKNYAALAIAPWGIPSLQLSQTTIDFARGREGSAASSTCRAGHCDPRVAPIRS